MSKEPEIANVAVNILSDHRRIKIDEKCILKVQNEIKNVSKEVKDACKIINFTSDCDFDDILTSIGRLNSKLYQKLFIFVINIQNFAIILNESAKKFGKLHEKLLEFANNRPMILQLTSIDENVSKFYTKNENSSLFNPINVQQSEAKVSSLLSHLLHPNYDKDEDEIVKKLEGIRDRSIIMRFLHTLTLSDELYGALVMIAAKNGTKSEIIAALDSPFECNGRILSNRVQKYITNMHEIDDEPKNDTSVLHTAIQHHNVDVIDYLMTYCVHLIQQLPFDHQIQISSIANDLKQFDVLSDLLDYVDYPFPNKIIFTLNQRLNDIIVCRMELASAIKEENFIKIDNFMNKNQRLKYIYSNENDTALTVALKFKKFSIFYYLKSLGCQGEYCDDILQKLSQTERQEAIKQAQIRRVHNVQKAKISANNAVHLLSIRSLIHNSRISKEQEDEYRNKIMTWFEDIYQVAPEMITVAGTCKYLRIIFDFECSSVENMSLSSANALGSSYSGRKWIFIGSKLSDRQRELQVKGVLAHELCHYVMYLVYENHENPYYKHMLSDMDKYDNVVKSIDIWSSSDVQDRNDECNGIISSVFIDYDSKDHHAELIVRAVQMLMEFSDVTMIKLQVKYIKLFGYWTVFVVPEFQKYCDENRVKVRQVNENFELISTIKHDKYELRIQKLVKKFDYNENSIIVTNIPRLVLTELYQQAYNKDGDQIDIKIIFFDALMLKNQEKARKFKKVMDKSPKIHLIVDVSKDELNLNLDKMTMTTIITSNVNHIQKLDSNNPMLHLTYDWNDLTEKTQKLLLKTKINFQNLNIKLSDLLLKEPNTSIMSLTNVIDDQLLNMLLEKSPIIINKKVNLNEKKFNLIFKARRFQRKRKLYILSQQQLIKDVKDKCYVLISDKAGNGKSWAMKNIANVLRDENPSSWVTYVDLKQFIGEFKEQMAVNAEPDFLSFMLKYILKPQQQFESNIFKKLYNDGKVYIIFDGYDEIAPNYDEFILNLAQNFQQNRGNQLWIATRDYFEVDITNRLKTDAVYNLIEMTDDEGIDLIAKSWMLDNTNYGHKINTKDDLSHFMNTSDFNEFQLEATKLVKKTAIIKFRSIGLPQLFKMIADGFQTAKIQDQLKIFKMFETFVIRLIKRWSGEKGDIRKNASEKSHTFETSIHKYHRYEATKSVFEGLEEIIFSGYSGREWKLEEIIAFGLMNMMNGKLNFIHETFREFFVADTILKALNSMNIYKNIKLFVKTLIAIFIIDKYEIIRMFLVDALNCDDEKSAKFQEILVKESSTSELKNLIRDKEFLNIMVKSKINVKFFDEFLKKIVNKIDKKFVVNVLGSINKKNEIFLVHFIKNSDLNSQKIQEMFKVLQNYDLFDLLTYCTEYGQTILQVCVLIEEPNSKYLEVVWKQVGIFYKQQNQFEILKKIITKVDLKNENILNTLCYNKNESSHRCLWNLLFNDLNDENELKVMLLNKYIDKDNFLQRLLFQCKNPEIIKLTFTRLKQILSNDNYQDILRIKGNFIIFISHTRHTSCDKTHI
ncbi:uncharacterized protein [Chironomus tepperi]|uniref:uncharacterized protein isoform X2 n=1 Tax=Chironomus tepperi TaxID=113505 RepID=UPI00391F46B8